jgi:hypothetical protein
LKGIRKMADRIFPSAKQDSLGNEKQINTIDWDVFAKNFKFAAEEDDETPEKEEEEIKVVDMSDSDLKKAIEEHMDEGDDIREFCEECPEDADCKPHCEEWLKRNPESEDEKDEDEDTEAGYGKMAEAAKKHPSPFIQKKIDEQKEKGPDKDGVDTENMPPALKKYHEDKKSSKPEESKVVRAKEVMCEKCAGKGCDACYDMKKKASAEGRVIVFNNPSEISAEALMAAKTAGDDVKVRAILAARETRNRVIEAKLESLAQEEVSKAQKLAQRREAREAIIAQADASVQRVASTEAKIAKSNKQEGFKTVASMQNNEKMIVAQRLLDNGFPKEYVEATLGLTATAEAVVTLEETHIREIMASSLNENTKRTAVASFVKVAELSQEQLDRCIRFWVDELGYGDEEWVRDLFAKK